MIGPAPKYEWDKYLVETGEIPVANKKWRGRGDLPYPLHGLDPKAPDDLKIKYESNTKNGKEKCLGALQGSMSQI